MREAGSRSPGRLSRRDFLRLGWAAGPPGRAQGRPDAPGDASRSTLRLGSLEELRALPVGSVEAYRAGGGARLYLVRLPEGLLALWARCPQDGYAVAWRAREPSEDDLAPRGRFYCPADASIFDRRGLVVAGPSLRPLDGVPLRVAGDLLWADSAGVTPRAAGGLGSALLRIEEGPL